MIFWMRCAVEKEVETHMNVKQKTMAKMWTHLSLVERLSLKQMKWRNGGITEEIAVKTNPPSAVKARNTEYEKDIQRNDVSEEGTDVGNERNHDGLENAARESLRV